MFDFWHHDSTPNSINRKATLFLGSYSVAKPFTDVSIVLKLSQKYTGIWHLSEADLEKVTVWQKRKSREECVGVGSFFFFFF